MKFQVFQDSADLGVGHASIAVLTLTGQPDVRERATRVLRSLERHIEVPERARDLQHRDQIAGLRADRDGACARGIAIAE